MRGFEHVLDMHFARNQQAGIWSGDSPLLGVVIVMFG